MLQEIVSYHLPETWSDADYHSKRYVLVDLATNAPEYRQVTAAFGELEVTKVRRLQNPFVYGRFKIKKEYLGLTSTVYESTAYHPIAAADVVKVAEHNCDYRRYSAGNGSQTTGKNPQFFSKPEDARDTFRHYAKDSPMCIVVVKLLNADASWDSQYVPEYVVYLA